MQQVIRTLRGSNDQSIMRFKALGPIREYERPVLLSQIIVTVEKGAKLMG